MLSSIMETAWRSAPMNFSVPIALVPAAQMPLAHAVWFSTRVTEGLEAYRPDIFSSSPYRSVQEASFALKNPRTYKLFDDDVLTPTGPDDNNWMTRRAAAVAFTGTYVMPTVAVGSRPVPFPAEVHGAIEEFSRNHRIEALDALLQSVGDVLSQTILRLVRDEGNVTDIADLMGYGMLSYAPSKCFRAGDNAGDEEYEKTHVLLDQLAIAALCRNIPPPPLSSRFIWKSYATAIARLEAAAAEEARALEATGGVPAGFVGYDYDIDKAVHNIGEGYRLGWLGSVLAYLGMRISVAAAEKEGLKGALDGLLSSARFIRGAERRLLLELGGKLILSYVAIRPKELSGNELTALAAAFFGNELTTLAAAFFGAAGNDFMDLMLRLRRGASYFIAARGLSEMHADLSDVDVRSAVAVLLMSAYSISPDSDLKNRIDRWLGSDRALAETYCDVAKGVSSLRGQITKIRLDLAIAQAKAALAADPDDDTRQFLSLVTRSGLHIVK